jgi:hypothetical protein
MRHEQTIQAILSSAENMRQTLSDSLQRVRGGFEHAFFKSSDIKIDPRIAERLAHMARK